MEDTLLSDEVLVILGGILVVVIILSLCRHYHQWAARYMGDEIVTFLKALLLR
ncbi:hypothetical protein BJ885_4337 [Enterobacter sp. WP_7_1]|nr:hypothetical protein BJ885_4337 [Enterobacter sp. WP_7_1]RMA87498.1 hypothetical protein BJ886_4454 [Enterobacter sp. WP_7_2]